MAELEKGKPVSLEELMVSTLAMTDALAKLLIEKGIITDAEFKQKLLEERAVYQRGHASNRLLLFACFEPHRWILAGYAIIATELQNRRERPCTGKSARDAVRDQAPDGF
jgi:hypothetical protein